MKIKIQYLKFLFLFIVFKSIFSGLIIPDPQNPIMVYQPSSVLFGQTIYLNFRLPLDSIGLGYKQIIGVQFPQTPKHQIDLATDIGVPQTTSSRFKCDLIDLNSNLGILVTPIVVSVSYDNTTFFCRIDDLTITMITGGSYQLQITLTNIRLNNSIFARQIGIFTCSSTIPERIIFDYNPAFADLAMYSDYSLISPSPLGIVADSVTTSPPSLNINTAFNLSFNILASQYYYSNQNLLFIRWPIDIIASGPTSIEISSAVSSPSALNSKYEPSTGSVKLLPSTIGNNTAIISGIIDDLVVGRSFKIILKGFVSSEIIGADKKFEIFVIYKNTYSIISYSSVNCLTTVQNRISSVTISSVDNFSNIYQGGAYNLQISFNILDPFPKPSFIVIQHSDAMLNSKKINFLPSTCDFSGMNNAGFNQNFGNRPICFPLRNDFNYPDINNYGMSYGGSGFAFKIPFISTGTFTFNIFAFVEYCVPPNSGISVSTVALYDFNLPQLFSNFNLSVSIYKRIDMTMSHEARFTTIVNNLIGSASGTSSVNCFPAISTYYNGGLGFNDDDTYSKSPNSVFIYNQFNDFKFSYMNTNSDTSCANGGTACFFSNIGGGNSLIFKEGSLINTSSSSTALNGSYVALIAFITLPSTSKFNRVCNLMACAVISSAYTPLSNYKIQLTTNSKFFNNGDNVSSCYFSWGIYITSNVWGTPTSPAQTALLNVNSSGVADTTQSTTRLKNIIAGGSTNYGFSSTSITSSPFTLTSIPFGLNNSNNLNALFPAEISTPNSSNTTSKLVFFGLYTSCIKWSDNILSLISSPYNYIDIQINVQETPSGSSNFYTTKVNRMIKFITDTYILDHTRQTQTSIASDQAVQFHVVNFPVVYDNSQFKYPSLYSNAVCMIQINSDIASITSSLLPGSNTAIFYLTNLMLLEMDYNDLTSTYPTSLNIPTYGINNVPFFMGLPYGSTNTWTNYSFWTKDYANSVNTSIDSFLPGSMKMRTIHKLFLGSTLWINFSGMNFNNAVNGNDLLIPTYCPLLSGTSGQNSVYNPLLNFVFANSSGFTTTFIDRVWNPPDNYANSCNSANCAYGYFTNVSLGTTKALPSTAADNPVYLTIRFNSYLNTNANQLYIVPATFTQNVSATPALASNWKCSGFTVFLSASLNILNPVTFTIDTNGTFNFIVNSLKTKFYLFGKPMATALLLKTEPIVFPPNTITNIINGIQRPNVESLIISNSLTNVSYLDVTDKLAFFCTSKGTSSSDYTYFTNYNNDITSSDPNFKTFILDWNINPQLNTLDLANISSDKSEGFYKNDPAGDLRFTIKMPTGVTIPGKYTSAIKLTNNQFNSFTKCAIQQKKSYANPCVFSTGSTSSFECPFETTENDIFLVCCYGVSINVDTINFPQLSIIFNVNPNSNSIISNYVWKQVYQINLSKIPILTTNNSNNLDMSQTNGITKITNIKYNYIWQELAYSKATLLVILPRQPVLGSKITISGDFSNFYISAYGAPRCVASFSLDGKSFMQGDGFIEGCNLNLSTSSSFITVIISNRIIKCQMPQFNKTLYINIWPISTINWANYPSNNYVVSMSYANTNLLNSNSGFPIIYNENPLSPRVIVSNQNNLCDVLRVTPNIINEMADYQFNFDLSSIAFLNIIPNEFYIFFPFQQYNINTSSDLNTITCYFGTIKPIKVSCSSLEENWLRIIVYSGVRLISDNILIVSGIQNPGYGKQLTFLCSVNYLEITTGMKNVISTGNGQYLPGFNDPPLSNNGYLLVSSIYSSENSPRMITNLSFQISFDKQINPLMQPSKLSNSPFFIVTLPYPEFNLGSYKDLTTITATIKESNSNSGSQVFSDVAVKNTYQLANIIIIYINDSELVISNTFKYWLLDLKGIMNPNEEINTSTGRFKITLSNSDISAVYRSYSNLSIIGINSLTSNFDKNTFNLINQTRGLRFTFNSKKYIIDLLCNNSLNQVKLRSGTAVGCSFYIRNPANTALLSSVKVTITLNDTLQFFKISKQFLILYTNINYVEFLLGVSCITPSGIYTITFSIDDNINFLPIPPIQVYVTNLANNNIASISSITDIISGGEHPFTITLSEFTSEQLTFTFIPFFNSQNDSSAIISDVVIPSFSKSGQGIFQIYNPTAIGKQSFYSNCQNQCWNSNKISVEFNVNASPINLNGLNLAKYITNYSNGDMDKTIPLNSINFSFSPQIYPFYLNCVLTTLDSDFPNNNEIIQANIIQSPMIRLISRYIGSKDPLSLIFSGLMRGLYYKLKCIGFTTETNIFMRTNTSFIMENFIDSKGNTTFISVTNNLNSACNIYTFSSDPGVGKINILNYCQSFFTKIPNTFTPLKVNPACLFCVDNLLNVPLGIFPTNYLPYPNSSNKNTRLLRKFLQNFSTNNINSSQNSYLWNLCVVQDSTCDNDNFSPGYNFSNYLANDFSKLIISTTDLNKFNFPSNITLINTSFNTNFSFNLNNSVEFDKDGLFNLTVSCNTDSKCFYYISNINVTPSSIMILNCQDYYCGTFKVLSNQSSYFTYSDSSFIGDVDTQYLFTVLCFNEKAPYSIKSQRFNFTFILRGIPINNQSEITENKTPDVNPYFCETPLCSTSKLYTATFILIFLLCILIF